MHISLGRATKTLNEYERLHYAERSRYARSLAWEIRCFLLENRIPLPLTPFACARLLVTRFSSGTPDYDNLVGGAKKLIDVLLPPGPPQLPKPGSKARPTRKYPYGLGIIADDGPEHLRATYESVRIKRGEPARTDIIIEEVERGFR